MGRQWFATAWGDPSHWRLVERELPAPAAGDVAIRVAAAGVNPADAKHVAVPRRNGVLPVPLGYEVSGVVTAVGADAAERFAVGDEVLAFRVRGGYATDIVVPAHSVFSKPATLSHPQAANLLLAGATAADMLRAVGATAGDTIVLHGASGAVGVMVLQLASLRGIRVIGTASAASFARVEAFGGIPVAYGPGLVDRLRAAAAGTVGAALDAVGTDEAVDASLALVSDRTRIVTIAAAARAVENGFLSLSGSQAESAAFRDGARGELVELARQGLLTVPVSRTFALAEAVDAVRFLAEGHPGGKIALVP